ncbi:MAG: hypothetical protein MHPDNHAH_00132 [Anaerolineales bacterium]|nr:hypothetical protein [Anaerolineales bacterium]
MNTRKPILLSLLLTFVLGACNAGTATPSNEVSLEGISTSAALTLTALASPTTPTPLSTSTPVPTITLMSVSTVTPFISTTVASLSGSSSATACDNAIYLSDVTIPDGTILTPGASFTKTWSLQNTGTCTWTTSYSIVYQSGDEMSGSTTSLSDSVGSGGSVEVSVDMIAPTTVGSYTGYWRLQNASGTAFGQAVYVQIVVAGSTSTVTSTPTATDETDTYTSTPTEVATSTPVPTETTAPTDTSEPTATETPSSN